MFDIKAVEKEATAELAAEKATAAKAAIKAKLRQIDAAAKVMSNLNAEYAVLLRDIGA